MLILCCCVFCFAAGDHHLRVWIGGPWGMPSNWYCYTGWYSEQTSWTLEVQEFEIGEPISGSVALAQACVAAACLSCLACYCTGAATQRLGFLLTCGLAHLMP